MQILDPKTHTAYMLDIETDGLSIFDNSITSLCLMRFNPATYEELENIYFRFNESLSGRTVCSETTNWRIKNFVDKAEHAINTSLPIFAGLQLIQKFVIPRNPTLFCNHAHFDAAFLKGYFEYYSRNVPFKYNKIYDLDSIIIGRGLCTREMRQKVNDNPQWHKREDTLIAANETAYLHDARHDCRYQIELLKAAMYNAY